MASTLPLPQLAASTLGALNIVTDNALARETGVRVAFTGRNGGASEGAYASLNLGSHVGDDPAAVAENRRRLAAAFGVSANHIIVPNQVHGTTLVSVRASDDDSIAQVRARAMSSEGADGIIVGVPDVAALLCFADCVPVIIVSPTGRFAVVHAGWRGVCASIAPKAARELVREDICQMGERAVDFGGEAGLLAGCNVYLGPHIRGECFETGPDVHADFICSFGEACDCGSRHISLARALTVDLVRSGISEKRIADVGICTVCHADEYFSYRASGGVCGRHAAMAVRKVGS